MSSSGNDNDDEGNSKKELTPTEQAIIEIMKRNNAAGAGTRIVPQPMPEPSDEPEKHAFWDTQVSKGNQQRLRAHVCRCTNHDENIVVAGIPCLCLCVSCVWGTHTHIHTYTYTHLSPLFYIPIPPPLHDVCPLI